MDVRDHYAGVRNILLEFGDDGVGVGNSYVCIDRKFGLTMQSER